MGWVLPKGTVEPGETYQQTALREVKEETNSDAEIVKYIGKTQYTFRGNEDIVSKTVHWYLMVTDSFDCKPQAEEFLLMPVFISNMRPVICSSSMMKSR